MKKLSILGILFLTFSISNHAQEILDGIVAIVGDEIILRSELLQTTQGFALQSGINPSTQKEEFEQLKKEILDNLINQKVLLAKAKEDTITAEDQEVEAELDTKVNYFIEQLGSREKVESYFGMEIGKIKKNYREEVRKNLIIQKLQREKQSSIQISRNQVIRFYETMKDSLPEKPPMVKLRHILLEIQPGGEARQQAMNTIKAIQERLEKGDDFKQLAREYSDDPGTAQRGGELGFVERNTFYQNFEEVAFSLASDEISGVVETPVGFHLIQGIEKRGDKVNVRHILIRLDMTQNDEELIKKEAWSLRERALAGEDFGELAKTYSADESSRDKKGDLDWLPIEELQIESFKIVADTLQVSHVSEPFQTRFGYHLVLMEDKSKRRNLSIEEDYQQIMEWAFNQKWQKEYNRWIEELKTGIYIHIKDDLL